MTGFITFITFIVAIAGGGWWWALFAFFFLGWLGTLQEGKENKKSNSTGSLPQEKDKRENERPEESEHHLVQDWPTELLNICSSLKENSYYVGDLIPDKKRSAAMVNYPLPGDPNILALIDATVFGSASCGLAIGKHGISWKNDFEDAVKFSWKSLANNPVSSSGLNVRVGQSKFSISGTGIQRVQLEKFLLRLQTYGQVLTFKDRPSTKVEKRVAPRVSKVAKPKQPIISVNDASLEELLGLPGIGAAEAHLIINRRGNQKFVSNTDLAEYLKLKPHMASRLEGLTDFGHVNKTSSAKPAPTKQTVNSEAKQTTFGGRTID